MQDNRTVAHLDKLLQVAQAEREELAIQQAATWEILKIIKNSPHDLRPVFEAILEKATRLCDASYGVLAIHDGDDMHRTVATRGLPSIFTKLLEGAVYLGPETGLGRLVRGAEFVHIPDAADDDGYRLGNPVRRALVDIAGTRTYLAVPFRKDDALTGSFTIYRREVQPFTERQIALLQNFADQAAIAIENARLINETRVALERQTATADILRVIASSPSDLQPVFQAIAERSNRLLGGHSTAVARFIADKVELVAFTPVSPEADAVLKSSFPAPLSTYPLFELVRNGEFVQLLDTESELGVSAGLREIGRARGYRSLLVVPLIEDGRPIGLISVTRKETGSFAEHHVQILRTFADQAVIAISNVNLFDQVQSRTHELSQSLDNLRSAQDRLIQTEKLASLGQLTAGIAHEIKNPLNFVNNFSSLSTELIDELTETLVNAGLGQKKQAEVGELTQMLKSNLEKVVQHGKRADSIVKNMLLHSREGSGERRSVDINSIVDESLNLAYHGARAERPGFNITLQRKLDSAAGMANVYPQEITRVLVNIISNGFYAATKRATEAANGFEPILSAATRNRGKDVEIRIRDNGIGMTPEVKNRIFTPFFTTKPPGEGTGLGLSMSHDIIAKQHGGMIDVETEPGVFTEFIITLPRKATDKSGIYR